MVIITGGSWAVGEWQFNQLAGAGLAHYFTCNDMPVINLARSSISNITQLELIETLLQQFTPTENDTFYWLVHNPLVGVSTEEIYQNKTSLADSFVEQIRKHLLFANTLAKKHNITINLIGASCDLNTVPVEPFSNLSVRVPSWGQLLDNRYPASIFGHQSDHMIELKQALIEHRPDLVNEYNQIAGFAFSKRRIMTQLPDLFQSFHPTSMAHQVLATTLMNLNL